MPLPLSPAWPVESRGAAYVWRPLQGVLAPAAVVRLILRTCLVFGANRHAERCPPGRHEIERHDPSFRVGVLPRRQEQLDRTGCVLTLPVDLTPRRVRNPRLDPPVHDIPPVDNLDLLGTLVVVVDDIF